VIKFLKKLFGPKPITNLELIEEQLKAAVKRNDDTVSVFFVARLPNEISIEKIKVVQGQTSSDVLSAILASGFEEDHSKDTKDLPEFRRV
jgi:hypothetical protein